MRSKGQAGSSVDQGTERHQKPSSAFTTLTAFPVEWLIALVIGLVHLAVAGRYDIFRNELYFIVCGRHPDFGYVDQPPLVPLLAATTQLFGDNPWLLRLPAVAAAAGLVSADGFFRQAARR